MFAPTRLLASCLMPINSSSSSMCHFLVQFRVAARIWKILIYFFPSFSSLIVIFNVQLSNI